jgi:hypothetical protein
MMNRKGLSKMPMPSKKEKDPMLDLEAALSEIESEKPDSQMNEHEDMESPDYEEKEESEMGEQEAPSDLSSYSDEELLKELAARKKKPVQGKI